MKRLFLLTSFSLLLAPFALAQGIQSGLNSIVLTPSANNPAPGQAITITAASYSFDIDSATIIWTVNGAQVKKGIGATTLDVRAPSLGKKTTVMVSAVTPSGSRFSNSTTIGSGSMDLVIETDGYTPPFFKGKVPLAFQNTATVIAVPHLVSSSGKEYDPATLVYQWKKDDGTVLGSQSGYGRQSISLVGNIVPRPYYLIVTASSRDGAAQAQGLAYIAPQSPSIIFYADDPLYGPLFNAAVNGTLHIGSQKESRAFASLFGFNVSKATTAGVGLDWFVNGVEHPELASSRSVVLRAPDGVSGTSDVRLDVRGTDAILQSASAAFTAAFTGGQAASAAAPATF